MTPVKEETTLSLAVTGSPCNLCLLKKEIKSHAIFLLFSCKPKAAKLHSWKQGFFN